MRKFCFHLTIWITFILTLLPLGGWCQTMRTFQIVNSSSNQQFKYSVSHDYRFAFSV